MKAEPVGEDSLRVWLSEKELGIWGVSLTPSTAPAGQGLRRLTRYILRRTGYPGHRLTAELFPVAGGAVLLLSPGRGGGFRWPAVYAIADEEALYALAQQWCCLSAEQPVVTGLYAGETGYRLTVNPVGSPGEAHRRLLREYGTLWGHGEAAVAHCAEYGRLLAAPNALERLMGH